MLWPQVNPLEVPPGSLKALFDFKLKLNYCFAKPKCVKIKIQNSNFKITFYIMREFTRFSWICFEKDLGKQERDPFTDLRRLLQSSDLTWTGMLSDLD